MPYIKQGDRYYIDKGIVPVKVGDLTYLITKNILDYIGDKESYAVYNEVIGALECAKLEFYRRKVAKYEDNKIMENGDVY
jgi:hypothetical protein